jgi:CheY-like chemotaxis protein
MFTETESKNLGIDLFLPKPIQTKALYQAINDLGPTQQTCKTVGERNAILTGQHHLLLAEDNDVNQRLVELIIKPMGYKLTMVSNGQQAVNAVAEQDFSLILMDCQMPLMDGYEAAKQIRQQVDTPIIALTAHASDEDVARCREAGMVDYLCKPYRQIQLLEMIEKHLPQKADPC